MQNKPSFPGFVDLLKQSWNIYKANFKIFVKLVALSIAFLLLVVLCGAVLLALLAQGGFSLVLIIVAIVSVIIIMVTQVWVQISLLLAVKSILAGEETSSARVLLSKAKPFILPFVVLSLITMFITLGGYMLFVIPGVLFAIWFSFSMFVLVEEKWRGMEALLASRDYIKGYVLKVFVRWLLFGIIAWLITSLVPIIFEVLDLAWIGTVYSVAVGLFVGHLTIVFGYLLFRAVKAHKPKLSVDISRRRKLKYFAVSLAGYIILVGGIIFLVWTW